MNNLCRIGILGGTLDPIHMGHLIIAQTAKQELNLEKIVFMPSGNPPHKNPAHITDAKHRLEMVKLSIDSNDDFVYSDFELKRDGVIYTSDTLELLKKEHPNLDLYFIMGADSLLAIETWHEPAKIFELATVVVADRDSSRKELLEQIDYLHKKYNANIRFISAPLIDISSSYIRNCVSTGKSIRYLVHSSVEEYINSNHLYTISF